MKVYPIFIIFSFLQTLICDKPGVNQQSLQEAFAISLPFIKSFHPEPFTLTGSSLGSLEFVYTELNSNNIEFIFDEHGLLHLKFVNIKGKVTGELYSNPRYKGGGLTPRSKIWLITNFTAELNKIGWEETYFIESTKQADGKYDMKFKSMSESSISFNI